MDNRAGMFTRRGTEAPDGQRYVTQPELKPIMEKFPDSFQRIRNFHRDKFGTAVLAVDLLSVKTHDPYFTPGRVQARLDDRVRRRQAGLDPFAGVSNIDLTDRKTIEI